MHSLTANQGPYLSNKALTAVFRHDSRHLRHSNSPCTSNNGNYQPSVSLITYHLINKHMARHLIQATHHPTLSNHHLNRLRPSNSSSSSSRRMPNRVLPCLKGTSSHRRDMHSNRRMDETHQGL